MRLFVALELPATLRTELSAVALPPGWRAVPVTSLHVTLAFLGSLPAADPVVDALPGTLPAVGELVVRRLRMLPPRRPRVLAVELEDPSGACVALQGIVVASLAAAGLYEPEARPWLPHVTVGRARGAADRRASLPELPGLRFVPPAVTLFESVLGRGPAAYAPVHSWRVSARS